jgi:glutamate-1-semialdehyde 2,1-aminomutase
MPASDTGASEGGAASGVLDARRDGGSRRPAGDADGVASRAAPEEIGALAARLLPGGVNSPTRLLEAAPDGRRGTVYVDEGSGSRVRDVRGRWYVDLHMCAGAAMLGHRAPALEQAIVGRLARGLCFAFSHPLEGVAAGRLQQRFPWLDRLRYVTSGSEAVASAIGAARVRTGRRRVLAFRECYHGWLAQRDEWITWLPLAREDLIADFLSAHAAELAAVILEPVPASSGVLRPPRALLDRLRTWCSRTGALLIFDEVITGFRVGMGGAAQALGVTPDLITLGKALSGGFPIAVYGGTEDAMSAVDPPGAWYQGGTLAAHPAGLEAVLVMHDALTPDVYAALEATGAALEEALIDVSELTGASLDVVRVGSMISVYWHATPSPGASATAAGRAAIQPYAAFHRAMLDEGVFLQAHANKPMFLSVAHDDDDIDVIRTAFLRAGCRLDERSR